MLDAQSRLAAALQDRYTIERELGAGGMATVYLAGDLKHKRQVAIKVLKPELAAVLGAERFVQEITTTAALQHPHILPLFDSGESDGFLWYAMPFIEGETLRAKLDRETQLSVGEAVKITTEVAEALHYAHTKGVVHRDIKPENILLANGRPMVADFGIALAVSAAAGGRMTETGMSLGTPHYMSPEQATADKEITGRSDVYSLASVCYEMLTGDPPHTGSSAQQIIMKIVAEEAQPVTRLRKSVPANVAAALGKALEKLPADRFATAKEFADALADRGFTTAATEIARGAAVVTGTRRTLLAAGWGVAALAAAVAAWGWLRPQPAPPVRRYAMALPDDQELGNLRGVRIAISPDGSRLAYQGTNGGQSRLLIRLRDQLVATAITGTDWGINPSFSPDGQRIAFATNVAGDGISVVGLTGAPPVSILQERVGGDGLVWASDGMIYYDGLTLGTTRGLMRIDPAGGAPVQVTTIDTAAGEGDHVFPVSLPDGRGLLYTIQRRNQREPPQVAVLDLATGTPRTLMSALTARYLPSGHLIYVTPTGDLVGVSFDLDRLEVTGEPFAVTSGVASRAFSAVDLAVSDNGTIVYTIGGQAEGAADLVYVTRTGEIEPLDTTWLDDFQNLALSPQGNRLAIAIEVATEIDTWVKALPDGPLTKLSFENAVNGRPSWHPDGQQVGYHTNRSTTREFWVGPADGSIPAVPLIRVDSQQVQEAFWSADGSWLLYRLEELPGKVYARRTTGDTTTRELKLSDNDAFSLSLSPDARWIAYNANESGTTEAYVRPFPEVERGRWTISTEGGWEPQWSRSGRELFFLTHANALQSLEVIPGPSFATGKRETLFDGNAYLGGIRTWTVAPDGRFLFIRQGAGENSKPDLVVVENLAAELRQRGGQ